MSRRRKAAKKRELPRGSTPGWLWVARGLVLVAMAGAAYLTWAALSGDPMPGCGPESGCDEVLSSRWARIFGVPVALGAFLNYGLLGWAAGGMRLKKPANEQRRRRVVAWFAAVLTLGAAVWFVALQVFVVGAFCVYCMTIHACGSIAALLVLINGGGVHASGKVRASVVEWGERRAATMAGSLAMVAVGVLVAGQWLHNPSRVVSHGTTDGIERSLGPARIDEIQASWTNGGSSLESTPRLLELHGGAFSFDLREVPYHGAADAKQVLVTLFDYTCRHCRVLHGFLEEVRRTFSNDLAIVSLPAPLDPNCNPLVPRHLPAHTNACEYARIGLAMWRADRSQSARFDHWIFAQPRVPSPEAAREHAIGLVGAELYARAARDPWVELQLEQATRLFATNYAVSRISRLPQLMIGTNIVVGDFRQVGALYQLLSERLNLVRP